MITVELEVLADVDIEVIAEKISQESDYHEVASFLNALTESDNLGEYLSNNWTEPGRDLPKLAAALNGKASDMITFLAAEIAKIQKTDEA